MLYMYECISKLNPKFTLQTFINKTLTVYAQQMSQSNHTRKIVWMLNPLNIAPFLDTSLKMTYPN